MIVDSAYPSLLQGVSQQVLHHRKEGQLSAQLNMLSDAVTGLRRRPGVKHRQYLSSWDTDDNSVRSEFAEFNGVGYHLILNSKTGRVLILNEDYSTKADLQNNYLIATDISKLRMTTVGGSAYLLNTEKKPAVGSSGAGKLNPSYDGFFYVITGAFSKSYTIIVSSPGWTNTYTYTTPNGTTAGDLALSTAEGIASGLVNLMVADAAFNARFDCAREAGYVYLTRKNKDTTAGATVVTSTAGKTYMQGSGAMNVTTIADLPANLPSVANGVVCSVGTTPRAYSYFQWVDATGIWKEVGSYTSADSLSNMPLKLSFSDTHVASLTAPAFEGRIAGDDENNPYPAFIAFGLTGIGAYQGRLVLLAGSYTCMSASNRPLRFMRSTTVDLRSDDPIEISAGALASASFEYAIPFNKDLLLFSSAHQAVIPAGNSAITSTNAMVVLSTANSVDTYAEPKVLGRTLMYSTAVSADYFGIGELVPSPDSEAQYVAQNLTEHIPRYIGGRCRGLVSSSNVSIGLFLSSTETQGVLVNEYLWSGNERAQNAWHKWFFAKPILSMHFARGVLHIICKDGTGIIVGSLDTRAASYQQSGSIPPFLDFYTTVTVVNNEFTVPVHLRGLYADLRAAQLSGDMSGEPIGIESINTGTWVARTIRSFPNGTMAVGVKFSSSFSPSPPLIRDSKGLPMLEAHTNVLKYVLQVRNTGEFNVDVVVENFVEFNTEPSAMLWSSTELGLGKKQTVGVGKVIIPVRAPSEQSSCNIFTDSTRELNCTTLEYTVRGVQKRKRV